MNAKRTNHEKNNPNVPNGRAPILGFLPALKESGVKINIHRIIAEGDLVVTHNSYDNAEAFGGAHMLAFDILRIKDGKIVEHWDIIAEIPAKSANDNGKF